MPDILLLALLFVAILIGYFLGRYSASRAERSEQSTVSRDYFVGLNYLLNEQPDEAIETFIGALDITSDTVDTYLALGTLFCKRGEVERSIRVHQDLLARPSLTPVQSIKVQLALARDYMSAGLFDRAEAMLIELVGQSHEFREEALRQLLNIYEQEKEWQKAIDIGESLKKNQDASCWRILAQYYCEQAEVYLANNDRAAARSYIKSAFSRDKNCVRASLLLGRIEYEEGRYREAIRVLERIARQDNRYVPLSIALLQRAYENSYSPRGLAGYLARCLNEKPASAVILAMTHLLVEEKGRDYAIDFLTTQLHKHPTLKGLDALIELQQQGNGQGEGSLALFKGITRNMLQLKPVFSCAACGFSGKDMHWQCPGCRAWGMIAPVQGIEGE